MAIGTPFGAIHATGGPEGVVVDVVVDMELDVVSGGRVVEEGLDPVVVGELAEDVHAETTRAAHARSDTARRRPPAIDVSIVESMAIHQVLRSPVVHRASIAIIAAIAVLAWPQLIGEFLFRLLGAVGLAAGLVEIFLSFRTREPKDVVSGLILVAAGSFLLFGGEAADRIAELVVAGVLAWRGFGQLIGAYRGRGSGDDPFWPVARGVLQLLLAAAIVVIPSTLFIWIIFLVAMVWILGGVVVIVNAIGESEDSHIPNDVIGVIREKSMPAQLRQTVSQAIFDGIDSHEGGMAFAALMSFATAIATFGIKADSTAVVIGAMLIAPLMTPIMALSASILMGWGRRMLLSGRRVAIGVAIGVGGSWLMSLLSPEFVAITSNSQVLSRSSPTLLDLLIALAAGAAGGYAVTHPKVGNSLPGVAIAVALAPPLAVVGYSMEEGQFVFALGAFLLFLTNLVGIIVAAGVTYVVSGYSPWTRIERAGDQSRRSLALVGIALLIVAIPLGIIGEGIVHQTTARTDANATINAWLGPDSSYDVVQVTVSGKEVTALITGSGDLPGDVEELAADLAESLQSDVDLILEVTPRETTEVHADYGGRLVDD